MANQVFDYLRCLGKARVQIAGSFQPNGANTTILGQKGRGFTVSHAAGANTYTVTMLDVFPDYDGIQLQIQSPTLGLQVQLVAEATFNTTKQFTIALLDSSTKAAQNDQAFNANTRIHFLVTFKNTTLGANY